MSLRNMLRGILNPVKGWPDSRGLDVAAKMSAAALAAVAPAAVPAGSVAHLTEDFEFALGCQNASGKVHMPIFLFHWSDHPDVANAGGVTGASDDDPMGWYGVMRGNMMGIVATAGVELQSDQYVDDDYLIGDPLRAITSDKGKISQGVLGTDLIIGTVSRLTGPAIQGPASPTVISFWPLCLPVYP